MKAIALLVLFLASFTAAHSQSAKLTIYFAFNSSELDASSKGSLDSLFGALHATKYKAISAIGNCDQIGNDRYNDSLSYKRAGTVRDYINGLIGAPVRIATDGKGKHNLINQDTTEDARRWNRRVEINVTYEVVKPEPKLVPQENTLIEKIRDTALKTGQTVVLKNINFYGGRHRVLAQSESELYELLEVMKSIPTLRIEIQGHISSPTVGRSYDGVDGYDYDSHDYHLSINRAKAIYDFLVSNGIDESRLSFKGFAFQHPLVNPERSEADKTTNRRVEIKILSK